MKHRFSIIVESHESFFTARVTKAKGQPDDLRSPAFDPKDSQARKSSLIRMLGDIGSVVGFKSFPSAMILEEQKNGHEDPA